MKGEHEVIFAGDGESLSIKHIADTREIFAEGALAAAKFVAFKPAGLYNMSDLI
jgi:4-hydroxy-tetrahydrodipicolinate reductase